MGSTVGLSRLDRRNNEYQLFQHHPEDTNTLSNNRIRSILRDRKGTLWAGTTNGLNKLVVDKENTHQFIRYLPKEGDSASISSNFVYHIYEDSKARLWISLTEGSLKLFDRQNESFLKVVYVENDQIINHVGEIKLEETDKIWTSCVHGPFEIMLPFRRSGPYTIAPDTIIHHKYHPSVDCMFKDHSGNYWLGTYGGGLIKMMIREDGESGARTYHFEHYTKKQGLGNEVIAAILEDGKGRLWLSTQMGISCFDPVTETFTNYNKTDGLLSRNFFGQGYKAPDGEMFFPSGDGLLAFYPDSIEDNPIIPPVVITDLKIFNKTVEVGEKSPLKASITHTKAITLPYNQNFLSIDYAAMNYLYAEKNRYKYKMEGLDPDWIDAGTRRHADYPDLKPGDYTFKVIGSNNNGIWNDEGATLNIKINPPWWATYLAYAIYILFAAMCVLGYVRLKTWQIRKQKNSLEKQVHQRTHQIEEHREEIESQKELLEEQNRKILEMDQMKTKFFNNVSHEFRTPLTLIQGPVEDLIINARLNKKEHNKLKMISRHAGRLLNLVNQLLDIAKLESGNMKLKLVNGDILQRLRIIAGSFSSLAETNGILYNRSIPKGKYNTWFDPGILEKIAVNLLSNAFKFTPEAGEITFRASWFHGKTIESPDQIEFSVSDQGPGIPENSMDKIFTRFYQVESKGHHTTTGTGIGLSLIRDLVNLNHGKITVESETGKGSTFTVSLPLGKDHLKESEFVIATEKEEYQVIAPEPKEIIMESSSPSGEVANSMKEEDKPIVLIVEDNSDIRSHIAENLENKYHIIEAVNGRAGLKKTVEIIPDLMITDLIMPIMDGIELCSQVRSDERTSHIPIVMLTAKSSLENKLEGLETGADDYLSKPFHMKELLTRIANLIEQRKRLRERFSKEITLEPREISITSLDEVFLKRAIHIVEENMADETFDLNIFQDAMHMSHSTLFRKLYALTNQSPTGFIRNIRLKRAAQLFKEHFGNVAKVSYEVGFNNPSYFSKCFKSLFGVSPVDYVKNDSLSDIPD